MSIFGRGERKRRLEQERRHHRLRFLAYEVVDTYRAARLSTNPMVRQEYERQLRELIDQVSLHLDDKDEWKP